MMTRIDNAPAERPTRVGVDLSILRRPRAGSARYAMGLASALARVADLELVAWRGPARVRSGGPARKIVNLIRERLWYDVGLPRVASQEDIDVLLMPVNLSARRTAIPQIVTIHDVNFLSQPETYDGGYAAYARRFFARSVRDADRLTTVSAYSKGEIIRHFGAPEEKIAVVYPGLAPVPPKPSGSRPLDRPYALYVGATEPHKNLGVLIEAWRPSAPHGLDLVLVGHPGRDQARLRELAEPIRSRVHLIGGVDAETLELWFRSASVFLYPSLTEGFGYPPLEAMQRGIPVISANAGALREVLGDAALFHYAADVATVREHVDRVCSDPDLRADLVARGAARAAQYTWPKTASIMAGIVRSLRSS